MPALRRQNNFAACLLHSVTRQGVSVRSDHYRKCPGKARRNCRKPFRADYLQIPYPATARFMRIVLQRKPVSHCRRPVTCSRIKVNPYADNSSTRYRSVLAIPTVSHSGQQAAFSPTTSTPHTVEVPVIRQATHIPKRRNADVLPGQRDA